MITPKPPPGLSRDLLQIEKDLRGRGKDEFYRVKVAGFCGSGKFKGIIARKKLTVN
jgi:hypothetical protein